MTLPGPVQTLLAEARNGDGPILWLTGAGISAESGIPTFRGKDGYWQVGSKNYRAEELATMAAFLEHPAEVWAWYLYRRSVCRQAAANPAHLALADLERSLGDRFLLITQNVDGLHLRAGNTRRRTFEIHGNIDYFRPVRGDGVHPLPEAIGDDWTKGRQLTAEEAQLLFIDDVAGRPHVLWFDESYDEENFRFESSLRAAEEASLLVIVGTSGATNLPRHVASAVARRGAPFLVINPDPSPFTELATELAEAGRPAAVLRGTAGEWVPRVCAALSEPTT